MCYEPFNSKGEMLMKFRLKLNRQQKIVAAIVLVIALLIPSVKLKGTSHYFAGGYTWVKRYPEPVFVHDKNIVVVMRNDPTVVGNFVAGISRLSKPPVEIKKK
jgi:hypothetical protein